MIYINIISSKRPKTSHRVLLIERQLTSQKIFEDDGYLPNNIHTTILNEFQNCRVYVVGEITRRFISNIIPEINVTNVCSLINFKFPKELPDPHCFRIHRHRYCSLAKARCIKSVWVQ